MHHSIHPLSDPALLGAVRHHVQTGLKSLVDLLRCLQEVEQRQLHLNQGFSSLFAYCCSLGFSENESWRRVAVARLSRRCPLILDALENGRVHLTGLSMLYTFGKAHPNADLIAWLGRIENKSKKEIEIILARQTPGANPPRPPVLRPLMLSGGAKQKNKADEGQATKPLFQLTSAGGLPMHGAGHGADAKTGAGAGAPAAAAAAAADHVATAADPEPKEEAGTVFFELRACLDAAAKADLDTVQNLLRHRLPHGDLNDVLKLVLREAAERLQAKKACALKKVSSQEDKTEPAGQPAAQSPKQEKPRTRPIPRAVRRTVYARDGGRCTWKSSAGQVCGATAFLEYNHIKAFALGGLHTVDNINLLCRAHNQLEGVALFGEAACAPRRKRSARVMGN
jgi:hypothetical protein